MDKKNIVVLDGYTLNPGDLSWGGLEKAGDCRIYDRTDAGDTLKRISGAEIILTNKVIINSETIRNSPGLKYIGVLATGYNVVDLEAATAAGITVTNIPAYGTDSVAQLVFAHILNVYNGVDLHARSVTAGEWAGCIDFSYTKSPQIELSGKTMGIIGFGRIGRKVALIADAFGMKVIFQNRSQIQDAPAGMTQKSLEEVAAESDILSINCPLTDTNKEFINKDFLGKMKREAVLVNTGRGLLINESDLADALNNGIIAAACLDVLSTEPPLPGNPLLKAKNCFITPHIAWATREARQRLLKIAIDNVNSFIEGNPLNRVNP